MCICPFKWMSSYLERCPRLESLDHIKVAFLIFEMSPKLLHSDWIKQCHYVNEFLWYLYLVYFPNNVVFYSFSHYLAYFTNISWNNIHLNLTFLHSQIFIKLLYLVIFFIRYSYIKKLHLTFILQSSSHFIIIYLI